MFKHTDVNPNYQHSQPESSPALDLLRGWRRLPVRSFGNVCLVLRHDHALRCIAGWLVVKTPCGHQAEPCHPALVSAPPWSRRPTGRYRGECWCSGDPLVGPADSPAPLLEGDRARLREYIEHTHGLVASDRVLQEALKIVCGERPAVVLSVARAPAENRGGL